MFNSVEFLDININNEEETFLSKLKELENEKYYLLNTKNTIYDELEQYIFNTAIFHFNRLNITFDESKHYIQFSCKHNSNYFIKLTTHNNIVSYNSQITYPLCSTITNLSNHNSLHFITPFNLTDYKYKKFEEKEQIFLIFSRKNKQIVFDPELYYGFCNINNEEDILVLYINLWDIKPNDEYYSSSTTLNNNMNLHICKNTNSPDKIFISNDVINKDFYEMMLYEKTNKSILKIIDHLQDIRYNYFDDVINKSKSGLIIQIDKIKLNDIKLFNDYKNKYGEIVGDIRSLFYEDVINPNNRFYNYNIYNNIINSDISKWIINEFEIHIDKNKMNTLVSIESIYSISSFVKILFENNIYNKIIETFKFYNNMFFKIKDIFIYKTCSAKNENFKEYKTNSFLIMYIPLNQTNSNDGLFFEDTNTIVNLKEFQMALLSCKKRSFYKKTTDNSNYFIVIILDLIL